MLKLGKFSVFLLILSAFVNTGCDALLKAAAAQKQATGQVPARAKTLTLPANKDRIYTLNYAPGPIFNPTVNPWGTRYKDYIFDSWDVTTEYYKKNDPNYKGGGDNLIMDIFTPKNDPERGRPCVIYVFGGGFASKIDDCTQEVVKGMVEKGYVVAATDYRIGFNGQYTVMACQGDFNADMYPAFLRAIQDLRDAVRYLKANAERLGIDKSKIFIGGQSAGALTSLAVGYVEDKDIDPNLLKVVGGSLDYGGSNLKENVSVAGVYSLSGAIVQPSVLQKSSKTPLLLIHGTQDDLVNPNVGAVFKCVGKNPTFPKVAGGNAIYEVMHTRVPIRLELVCKGGHGMGTVGYPKLLDLISTFTYSVLQGNPITGKEIIEAAVPVRQDNSLCK